LHCLWVEELGAGAKELRLTSITDWHRGAQICSSRTGGDARFPFSSS
jgi:hypothetical protein